MIVYIEKMALTVTLTRTNSFGVNYIVEHSQKNVQLTKITGNEAAKSENNWHETARTFGT